MNNVYGIWCNKRNKWYRGSSSWGDEPKLYAKKSHTRSAITAHNCNCNSQIDWSTLLRVEFKLDAVDKEWMGE